MTVPEEILSCLESDANTATFIDKLGHFSGANIKKITGILQLSYLVILSE